MSIWSAGQKNVVDEPTELSNSSKNAYSKIDATIKLQIIQALDNGQCKTDVSKEYGLHPQTITAIYKKKDSIIKKYTQKYEWLKRVCSLNLDQKLLEWFEHQYTSGYDVSEEHLCSKAKDILKGISEEFTCINDWLFNFQVRHNISKCDSDIVCNQQDKIEWKRFLQNSVTSEVYLGGVCALSYSLDLSSYINGERMDDYVSLFFVLNTLGSDKKELAVVGSEALQTEANIKSLPVDYYYSNNTQINYSTIHKYLTKWDSILASQGKSVTLILNIPGNLIRILKFVNIRLISSTEMKLVTMILDKLVECFKYQYRKLQIIRNVTYGKDSCTFLDYLHMIGMAWYSVPYKYVQSLSFPPDNGYLCFINEEDCDYSISKWCRTYNFPLNAEGSSNMIDKYILCDKKLPCINCGPLDGSMQASTEVLSHKTCEPTSGMEAYQAMKRLVSYLQSENAGGSVLKYAKYLENNLEYGALVQMHQIISSTNDSM